jgi:hypothetical protein
LAEKSSKGSNRERRLILDIEDCFKKPELDGGEEKRKLWNFYREETDDEAIIRRAKRDAYEHQTKYLMCSQSVYFGVSRNLGFANKEVYRAGSYLCGGMGGDNMCGCLLGARLAMGQAYGRDNMYSPGWPRSREHTHFFETLLIADDELSNAFKDRFGSCLCHEIQEKYYGRHLFFPSDYEDPEIWERHKSGELYRVVSTYAAALCEWTAGKATELILREWKETSVPPYNIFRC